MNIATQSYETIYSDYQNSLIWMKSLGINFSPGRTQNYEKTIRHWKSAYKTASDEQGKESFLDIVSSLYEISDFIDIHKSLQFVSPTQLKSIAEKLQKGVNGPINSAEETSSSSKARNYIFEALVASRCHAPDQDVEAIFNSASDTGLKTDNKKIWIECKRITSLNKLEANIRDACNQLEETLNKKLGSSHRGLVAVDFTKVLHSGDKLLVKDDDSSLQQAITEIMSLFISNHSNEWEKVFKSKHKKIIGTLLRFSTMAISEKRNLLVRVSDWGINPKREISNADSDCLKNLARILNEKQT